MTRTSASRVLHALALVFLGFPATPSLRAQKNQWNQHMKAGGKAYRSYNFAKAEKDDPIFLWSSEIELAEIYRQKGDTAAAEPVFERSLEMTQHMTRPPGAQTWEHPKLAQMLDNYATLLRDEGKYDQAEALYKRSLESWAKYKDPDDPNLAQTLSNYAELLRKMDRPAEAEHLEERASAIRAKIGPSNPVN